MNVQDKIAESWEIANEMLEVLISNPGCGDDPAVVAAAISKLITGVAEIHDKVNILGLILYHLDISNPELFS